MLARGWRSRRRYGALLVHLGLLTLVIGLVGSWSFKDSVERELALGESLSLGKVEVVYQDLDVQPAGATDKEVTRATLGLSIDGRGAGELVPALEYYPANDQIWTRVAKRTSAAGDVYVSLLAVGADGETIDLKLEYHPLIVWLWIGGGIMSLGAIVALWSLRRRPRGAPLDPAGGPAPPDAPTAYG